MQVGIFRIGSLQAGGGICHLGKVSRRKSQISWNNMASQSPPRNCGFKSWSAIWATNWSQIRLDENQCQARSNGSETNLSFLLFLGSNCILFNRDDEYFFKFLFSGEEMIEYVSHLNSKLVMAPWKDSIRRSLALTIERILTKKVLYFNSIN